LLFKFSNLYFFKCYQDWLANLDSRNPAARQFNLKLPAAF